MPPRFRRTKDGKKKICIAISASTRKRCKKAVGTQYPGNEGEEGLCYIHAGNDAAIERMNTRNAAIRGDAEAEPEAGPEAGAVQPAPPGVQPAPPGVQPAPPGGGQPDEPQNEPPAPPTAPPTGSPPMEDPTENFTSDPEGFPDNVNYCEYFRQRLSALHQPAIVGGNTGQGTADYDDIVRAVLSVTAAITGLQQPGGGFSAMTSEQIQMAQHLFQMQLNGMRPRRPLLVPLIYGTAPALHNVLAVMQLNATTGQPTISILDSAIHAFDPTERDQLYRICVNIMTAPWGRNDARWTDGTTPLTTPDHLTFPRMPQQETHLECGYYTVLFGWASAMGLEINPNFVPPAGEAAKQAFWKTVQDMMAYARRGSLNWKDIYSFLHCYNFIIPTAEGVPIHRRFEWTRSMHTEQDMNDYLIDQNTSDDIYGGPHETGDWANVRIPPGGRLHNDVFPSDDAQWNSRTYATNFGRRTARQMAKDIRSRFLAQYDQDDNAQQLLAKHRALFTGALVPVYPGAPATPAPGHH